MEGELIGTRAAVRRFVADLAEAHEGELDEPIWLSTFLDCLGFSAARSISAVLRVRPWTCERHPSGILYANLTTPVEIRLPGDRVLILPRFLGCVYKIVAAGNHAAARLGFEPGQALELRDPRGNEIVLAILLDPTELDLICAGRTLAYLPTECKPS